MSFLEGLGADATLLDVYRRHPALARHTSWGWPRRPSS